MKAKPLTAERVAALAAIRSKSHVGRPLTSEFLIDVRALAREVEGGRRVIGALEAWADTLLAAKDRNGGIGQFMAKQIREIIREARRNKGGADGQ